MIKPMLIGLWMPTAMFLSGLVTSHIVLDRQFTDDGALVVGGLDYEDLRPVNVPMIADGALQGYVVAKLVFTADANVLRSMPIPPHPFLVDEVFRTLYADETLDFRNLEKYDLDRLTSDLAEIANKRIGEDVIQDVLVEEFNYFDKDTVITY